MRQGSYALILALVSEKDKQNCVIVIVLREMRILIIQDRFTQEQGDASVRDLPGLLQDWDMKYQVDKILTKSQYPSFVSNLYISKFAIHTLLPFHFSKGGSLAGRAL